MDFTRLRLAARSACGPRARYRAARALLLRLRFEHGHARLRERAPAARALGAARLPDYAWRCNKRSADGTGRANLVPEPGAETWGVLYEVNDRDWEALDPRRARLRAHLRRSGARRCTRRRADLRLGSHCGRLVARTWYLGLLVAGAREHALPPAWIAAIEALAPKQEAVAGEQMVFEDPANLCFGCSPHNPRGLQLAFLKIDSRRSRSALRRGARSVRNDRRDPRRRPGCDPRRGDGLRRACHVDDAKETDVAPVELSLKYRRPAPTGNRCWSRALRARREHDIWLTGEIRDAEELSVPRRSRVGEDWRE